MPHAEQRHWKPCHKGTVGIEQSQIAKWKGLNENWHPEQDKKLILFVVNDYNGKQPG